MNTEQLQKMATAPGFIAALDQSGGSTPKALRLYGLEESTYSGEAEMFDLIHQMRTRIMTSSAFTGERILGAILFEMTMERQVEGMGAAEYLLPSALIGELDMLGPDQRVMLKLTLPEQDGHLTPLVEHPRVLRVVALSGGYSRANANARLAHQPGVVASFSRALTEGLTAQQSPEEFDAMLNSAIASIYAASSTRRGRQVLEAA